MVQLYRRCINILRWGWRDPSGMYLFAGLHPQRRILQYENLGVRIHVSCKTYWMADKDRQSCHRDLVFVLLNGAQPCPPLLMEMTDHTLPCSHVSVLCGNFGLIFGNKICLVLQVIWHIQSRSSIEAVSISIRRYTHRISSAWIWPIRGYVEYVTFQGPATSSHINSL